MPHNPLTRDFELKLANLQRLAHLVEETLAIRAEELDARLSAESESYTAEERQDFFEYYAVDYYELADELPTLLRYSVLTGADTGLEVYLKNTCETFAKVHGATVKLADFRGAGIERARGYLKKVARMPFPDEQPEWTTVKRLHQLRNAIVHADGNVPPSQNDMRQWCATIGGLQLTSSGEIALARDFTNTVIAAYRSFASQVDDACVQLGLWQSVFPLNEDV